MFGLLHNSVLRCPTSGALAGHVRRRLDKTKTLKGIA
jgi:hypothetical protein